MPKMDYSKTVIYKLQHKMKDELLYIGHTTNFAKRKVQHKQNCYNANGTHYNLKLYTMIRDNDGWDAFNMVVVKEFPCENKRQAEAEEDRTIRLMKPNMNMRMAFIPPEERKEYFQEKDREYRTLHREELKIKNRDYRNKDKEKWDKYNKEYKRKYYEQNKEELLSKNRERYHLYSDVYKNTHKIWYEKNRDKILAKNKELTNCECGGKYTHGHKLRHFKTLKHQKYLDSQNSSVSKFQNEEDILNKI